MPCWDSVVLVLQNVDFVLHFVAFIICSWISDWSVCGIIDMQDHCTHYPEYWLWDYGIVMWHHQEFLYVYLWGCPSGQNDKKGGATECITCRILHNPSIKHMISQIEWYLMPFTACIEIWKPFAYWNLNPPQYITNII